jgi:hypothetical protein
MWNLECVTFERKRRSRKRESTNSERVPERNRAAIHVHLLAVQPELLLDGQALAPFKMRSRKNTKY